MKTNKIVITLALLMLLCVGASADNAKTICLSEISLGDSTTAPWIEVKNSSWGTRNLGGYYITNNRHVLDSISAPERKALMHLIPTGNPVTKITPQNCLMLTADAKDNLGIQHLNFEIKAGDFIAIYSGNGEDLIDSVTVPALAEGQSYAVNSDYTAWAICDKPTPTMANDYETAKTNDKIGEFAEKDKHGFAMAIMAMGVVFSCLILLYVFFSLFGFVFRKINSRNQCVAATDPTKKVSVPGAAGEAEVAAIMAVTEATAGTGDENLDVALIALAIEAELAHDEESGVITIKPTQSPWASKSEQIAAGMLR